MQGKKGKRGNNKRGGGGKGKQKEAPRDNVDGADAIEGELDNDTTPYIGMVKRKLLRSSTPEEIEVVTKIHQQLQSATKDERGAVETPREGKLVGLYEQLVNFNNDSKEWQFDYPATLNSRDRAMLHEIAGKMGLEHSSSGFGKHRHLMIKKPFDAKVAISADGKMEELLYYSGYVGLTGPVVSATARKDLVESFPIPKGYINTRIRRDGNENHITLITKQEMDGQIIPRWQSEKGLNFTDAVTNIMDKLEREVIDDWTDLGLGHVTSGGDKPNNEVLFRVIEWPSGDKLRESLGLPKKDFHITVGFKTSDIHHVPKGPETLVKQEK